jgi:hypothetical protein
LNFAAAADGWAGHELSTRHGLICAALLTTAPTGAKILSCEAAQGTDLMMAALPQGPLYRHTKEGEYANPQGDKKRFDHACWLAANMPCNKAGRDAVKSPSTTILCPKKDDLRPKNGHPKRIRARLRRALVVACCSSGL